MTDTEHTIAVANSYSQVQDMLRIEELILAVMHPREPETRSAVGAQIARVAAIKTVLGTFERALPTPAKVLAS